MDLKDMMKAIKLLISSKKSLTLVENEEGIHLVGSGMDAKESVNLLNRAYIQQLSKLDKVTAIQVISNLFNEIE